MTVVCYLVGTVQLILTLYTLDVKSLLLNQPLGLKFTALAALLLFMTIVSLTARKDGNRLFTMHLEKELIRAGYRVHKNF